MTSNSITLPNALQKLQITDDGSGKDQQTYTTVGTTPQSIINHTVETTYNMLGVTPAEFINQHGATTVDFKQLIKDFKKICLDYDDQLDSQTPSKAVEFCSKMLYEVGPMARQVRKKDNDKTWKFMFLYKMADRLVVKVAFVSTYKKDTNDYIHEATTDRITLSVKNASLLAIRTLEKINCLAITCNPPIMLLTPLAGAVFSRDDIPTMAAGIKETELIVLHIINASCQSGGHYLTLYS